MELKYTFTIIKLKPYSMKNLYIFCPAGVFVSCPVFLPLCACGHQYRQQRTG
jgi:hypothetical protein